MVIQPIADHRVVVFLQENETTDFYFPSMSLWGAAVARPGPLLSKPPDFDQPHDRSAWVPGRIPGRGCLTTTHFRQASNKTLKYAPVFPERFASLHAARQFIDQFVEYYNHDHRHFGIGLHTRPMSNPTRSPPTATPKSWTYRRPPGSTNREKVTPQPKINSRWPHQA